MNYFNDAKYIWSDQNTSSLSGTLLASSTIDRTALYGIISTDDSDSHMDIVLNGVTTTRYIDAENGTGHYEQQSQVLIPAGATVYWTKIQTNKKAYFGLQYVDYNVASSTPQINLQNDTSTLVIIGLIVIVLLGIDFIRRLFMPFAR